MSTTFVDASISALSPLDGRYHAKLAPLRPLLSEHGYMHRRVQVEVTWFIALTQANLAQCPALSPAATAHMLGLVSQFSESDTHAIKLIERETNHDVKAVEYWIKRSFANDNVGTDLQEELARAAEFVHFACTSEDINNTSHALQIKAAREHVMLPLIADITHKLQRMATAYAHVPMLSRTHGQTASPTTVGKEIANVAVRLQRATLRIEQVAIMAKMNGAVGNYNAHLSAWPDVD